jgi:hypothetical protein
MSNGSCPHGINAPAASSTLNDSDAMKTDNREDDAALVDSFFLPGGLFSDETNNKHQNENDIANRNCDLRIGSITHNKTPRSFVQVPKNPWETETSESIAARLTNAATGSSSRILNLPQSSTKYLEYKERPLKCDNTNVNITDRIDHFNYDNQHINGVEGNVTGTIVETPPLHQEADVAFSQGNQNLVFDIDSSSTKRGNDSVRILRPPPGFQNSPTLAPSVDNTYVTGLSQHHSQTVTKRSNEFATAGASTSTGNKCLFPSRDHCRETLTSKEPLFGLDDSCDGPILTPSLSYSSVDCPLQSFQQVSLQSNNTEKAIDVKISESYLPTRSIQNDHNDNEETNSYRARYLKKPLPATVTAELNKESKGDLKSLVVPTAVGSNDKSQKSNDYIADDYGDDGAETHEEDTEENSIPLHICVSVGSESNFSSLSTFSEVDNNSELSSLASGKNDNMDDDYLKEEGIGYDTDQAHVSQIVDMVGNSLSSAVGDDGILDDEQSTNPSPSVKLEGATRTIHSVNENHRDSYEKQLKAAFTVEKMMMFFRCAAETFYCSIDSIYSAMQRSLVYATASKRYESFSRQIRKVSREFENLWNWLIDVQELCTVLLIHLLKVGRKYSRDIVGAAIIVLTFLFQILKFGIIEAIEEFRGVTSCYIVFYLIPGMCVLLMDFINLPHWTPHTVTWLSIFSLCNQVDSGKLYETFHFSMSPFISMLGKGSLASSSIMPTNEITSRSTSEKTNTQKSPPTLQEQDKLSRLQDKQVCFLLLKILKAIVPVLYVVEGFSSEFGSIIGTSGVNRLTAAFVLSLLRKSIISSPIGWVSWAIQVLLGNYCSSWIFLELLILFIGLSSIRLIRFVDLQQTLGKQPYERTNR